MNSSRLVTTKTACEQLGMRRSTFFDAIRRGDITPADKLPGLTGAFIFDPDEIDRFRRARESAARPGGEQR